MTLETPNLDDRTFADLRREALAVIAERCPQWTDLSASDPGVADYDLWIDTATPGVKWSNGAVWTDIITARLVAYSTTAQMNVAIAASPSAPRSSR